MCDSQFKTTRILICCVQSRSTARAESWSDTSSTRHPKKTLLLENSQRILETLPCDLTSRALTPRQVTSILRLSKPMQAPDFLPTRVHEIELICIIDTCLFDLQLDAHLSGAFSRGRSHPADCLGKGGNC